MQKIKIILTKKEQIKTKKISKINFEINNENEEKVIDEIADFIINSGSYIDKDCAGEVFNKMSKEISDIFENKEIKKDVFKFDFKNSKLKIKFY